MNAAQLAARDALARLQLGRDAHDRKEVYWQVLQRLVTLAPNELEVAVDMVLAQP